MFVPSSHLPYELVLGNAMITTSSSSASSRIGLPRKQQQMQGKHIHQVKLKKEMLSKITKIKTLKATFIRWITSEEIISNNSLPIRNTRTFVRDNGQALDVPPGFGLSMCDLLQSFTIISFPFAR